MSHDPESKVLSETILMANMIPGVRLYRNNVGKAEIKGRYVSFGLFPGAPDGLGFVSVIITPDMVGKRVAIALGVETKTLKGKLRKAQEQALQVLDAWGGIALVIRDALELKPSIRRHRLFEKKKDHTG